MIEVQINDEITDYEEKITPIMTMKQCIISGITVLLVTPIFLILKSKVGYEIAAYLTLPFIGIGFCFSFVKYQGMTFREVSCEIIKWAILRPRRRDYKTENIYDYIKK